MSTVIFLNGTSSAGKTTLARALQDTSGQPMLYTGLDVCFGMVPANWGGGRAGHLSAEGFQYHTERDPTGAPVVTIEHGPVGLRMLRAHQKSAAALAASGFDLVIDEMLLSQQALDGWLATLDSSRTYFLGVHCGLPELERREAGRRNPRGLA